MFIHQKCPRTRSTTRSWYPFVASSFQPSSCKSNIQVPTPLTTWFRGGTVLTLSSLWKVKCLRLSTGSSWLTLFTTTSRCSSLRGASLRTRRSYRMYPLLRTRIRGRAGPPLNWRLTSRSMQNSSLTSVFIKSHSWLWMLTTYLVPS